MIKNTLCILSIFTFSFLYGQFSPSIQNYTIAEYKAGNQNWDVSRATNGKVYIANNSGLLEFDSKDWKFYQLPNKTTVRSVLAVDDVVFTGSYEEFGFWKKDKKGLLKYESLSKTLDEKISPNEEIWEIVKFNDKIVFRSFSNIYIYDNYDIEQLKSRSTIISINIIDNNLYVCTLNNGIYILENNTLKLFYFNSDLLNTKIIALTTFKDKLLLMTSLKGSFYIDNNTLVGTDFNINKKIKQNQLNEFSVLVNGEMIFGTIKDGAYITDSTGKLKFHISKQNGLLNNTILGQHIDEENNLWLGLDNGIANIDVDSPNHFYNDISGKLGAVYDVIDFDNSLYIGSNTGLFRLNSKGNLKFIEGSQGQVWDLKIIDDELFCGHNEGTFLVKGEKIIKISDYTGGWTIKKVPEKKDSYMQGTYTGLVKFKKESGQWSVKHMGKTTIPSRFLVFEDSYIAWVAHAYKGIYRVKFDKNYDSITTVKNYSFKGDKSNYNIRVYNIKNEIVFKTNDGWQKYEPILDSIVPYNLLDKKLGKHSYIISEDKIGTISLKDSTGLIKFTSLDDSSVKTLNISYVKNRYIVGYENVSQIRDSIYALNLDDGFMLIDGKYNYSNKIFKPNIEVVKINGKPIDLEIFDNGMIELKHDENLNVEVASPKSSNHFFEYNISQLSNSWFKIENRTLELSNIKNGEYQIAFRTRDDFGSVSEAKILSVDVLPPWYKGKIGYLLYLLLAILSVALFYYLHQIKINKEQRLIKIKLRKEQQKLLREKTFENEKRIVQVKNESLQNEIKMKSKQLANTAMALVKKNETLQDIKQELLVNKESFNNYYAYKKLVKRIDSSIKRKDEWEVFEENFNQVHDDFFMQLKVLHPKLTSKDLKICAYIKMNLATKEIAPLLNISVRGVETHRYRLKRKLNLENGISLPDYLLNIK